MTKRKEITVAIGFGLFFILASCADDSAPSTSQGVDSTLDVQATSTQPPTTTTSEVTTTSLATTTTTVVATPDAEAVVLALAAEGLPIDDYIVYDAASDPNELLGRPGGYTSKVNFSDSRLEVGSDFDIDYGGSVEVFPNESDAADRYAYVDAITSGGGLFGEYHWLQHTVFLRISKSVTPDEAGEYQQALDNALERLAQGFNPPRLSEESSDTAEPTTALDPNHSPFVGGVGDVTLPDGADGNLEVILTGPYTSSLPIVIQNRTPEPLLRVEVSAVARLPDGSILVTGSDQGLNPNRVEPGEVAYGYVYLDGVDLPPDVSFEFTLDAEPADGDFAELENIRDLEAVSAAFRDGRVTGEFTNTTSTRIEGPIQASVLCFTATGSEIVDVHSDFTDQDFVEPGGTLPFTVSIRSGDCSNFLFTASGFSD